MSEQDQQSDEDVQGRRPDNPADPEGKLQEGEVRASDSLADGAVEENEHLPGE